MGTEEADESKNGKGDIADEEQPKKRKVKKRETPLKFRLALHTGTILKAPKLCQDIEKILEKSERRTMEEKDEESDQEAESEYREPTDLEGNFKEPLPKGAGDCTHLSMLLGVVVNESDDTISHRTNSTSYDTISQRTTAIIEVDRELEGEDTDVFLPHSPSQMSVISGDFRARSQRAQREDQDSQKSQKEDTNERDPELEFSENSSTSSSESDSETEEAAKTPEPIKPDKSQDSQSSKTNASVGKNETRSEKKDADRESDQKSVTSSKKSAAKIIEKSGKTTPTNYSHDEEPSVSLSTSGVTTGRYRSKANSQNENDSPVPILPSERETPYKNEADIEGSENETSEVEARKMDKLSRKERDEKYPALQRSVDSSSSSSSSGGSRDSSRRSTVENVEYVSGNHERSAIALSVSPEREAPIVTRQETPKESLHVEKPANKSESEGLSTNELKKQKIELKDHENGTKYDTEAVESKPELNNPQPSLNEQEVNLFKEVLDPVNQEPENEPPSKQTPALKNESVVENAATAAEESTSSKIDTQKDKETKEDKAQFDQNTRVEETSQ